MVRIVALGVLCAWVCVLHSSEAVPTPVADVVSLASIDERRSQPSPAENAIEEANEDLRKAGQKRRSYTPKPASFKESPNMPPKRDGTLRPGEIGYLAQMIRGPTKTFQQTMDEIDDHLKAKRIRARTRAYQHQQAEVLAQKAADAVANMAQEVGTEADENAEERQADAAKCATDLHNADKAGGAAQKELEAKCAKLHLEALKAMDETTQATSAADKAVEQAGHNQGLTIAEFEMHKDPTSYEIDAQNAADAAAAHLKTSDEQAKLAQAIRSERHQRKLRNDAKMEQMHLNFKKLLDRHDKQHAQHEMKTGRPFRPLTVLPTSHVSSASSSSHVSSASSSSQGTAAREAVDRAMNNFKQVEHRRP